MEYTLKINDILEHASGSYRITGFKEYGSKPISVMLITPLEEVEKRGYTGRPNEIIYFSKEEVKYCLRFMTGKRYDCINIVHNDGSTEQIDL